MDLDLNATNGLKDSDFGWFRIKDGFFSDTGHGQLDKDGSQDYWTIAVYWFFMDG